MTPRFLGEGHVDVPLLREGVADLELGVVAGSEGTLPVVPELPPLPVAMAGIRAKRRMPATSGWAIAYAQ